MTTIKKVRNLLLCLAMLTAYSAMAEQKSIEVNFSIDDIEAVHIEGSKVWIKLAKQPKIKLATITGKNIGKSLDLKINTIPAVYFTIRAKIDSGRILVRVASDRLLNLLSSIPPARNKIQE